MFTVLYAKDNSISKLGSYDSEEHADQAAKEAQRDGTFDITEQDVLIVRPDGKTAAYSMADLGK